MIFACLPVKKVHDVNMGSTALVPVTEDAGAFALKAAAVVVTTFVVDSLRVPSLVAAGVAGRNKQLRRYYMTSSDT